MINIFSTIFNRYEKFNSFLPCLYDTTLITQVIIKALSLGISQGLTRNIDINKNSTLKIQRVFLSNRNTYETTVNIIGRI